MSKEVGDLALLIAIHKADSAKLDCLESSLGVSRATVLRRISRVKRTYDVDIRSIRINGGREYCIASWGVFDKDKFLVYIDSLLKVPK
jgi:hypothetical protein